MLSLLRYIAFCLVFVLCLLAGACSDGLGCDAPIQPGTLTVRLVTGAVGGLSRADIPASPDSLSPATDDERRINDLRLYAFPVDGGELLKVALTPLPTVAETADEQYKNYVIENVKPGKYRIYVIANQPSCADVKTEAALKERLLTYSVKALPVPGSLPMVFEPRETTEIGPGGTDVTANLQFTCVKVRYNLIFDKVNNPTTAQNFGETGLLISSIKGERLTASTHLVLGGAMSDINSGDSFTAPLAAGRYFASWSENQKAPADKDVIAVNGTDVPSSYADRWVYQGTLYLPERYLSNDEGQSVLTIEAITVDKTLAPEDDGSVAPSLPSGSKNTYHIPLGHKNADDQPRQFPRGTYYEIIGRLETTEFTEYQTEVHVRDWVPVAMADFRHTTLAVDKTRAKVGSLTYDSICYVSNAPTVAMGCDDKIEGKPVIVQYNHNVEKGILTFRINPEIPVSAFREGSEFPPHGSTKVWIQANNLRKYLDVEYDVTPMFVVKPLDVTINWLENESESPTYIKTFAYETNLGGVSFIDHDSLPFTLTQGSSQVEIDCADPTKSIGTFTVTATCKPEHEEVHVFSVGPRDAGFETLNRQIHVTVKPPVGNYRILFRAINDRQGGHTFTAAAVNYGIVLSEDGANNWDDGWDNHNIYAYTQVGETVGENIPEYYVWRFTPQWPGAPIGRSDFPGWYIKEFLPDQRASNTAASGFPASEKVIKPGETLLMFNSDTKDNPSRHRCTHAFDPGMQLFDYEDREGWIIYDPLIQEPYYTVFDSKPEIQNVLYTIYSTKKPTRWYRNYGKASKKSDGSGYYEFSIQSNITTLKAGSDADGNVWYKTTNIVLKSPVGMFEKSIVIQFEDGTQSVIFGGANYIDDERNAIGSYNNGVWSQGKPNFAEKSPTKTAYFYNDDSWQYVNAYCWTKANNQNMSSWPGTPMVSIGNGWYKMEIDSKYDMIIFNNNISQTGDLSFAGSTVYYNSKGQDPIIRP